MKLIYAIYFSIMAFALYELPWPLKVCFAVGAAMSAGLVGIYYDGMWGQYNHANGRSWGWRPSWKSDFSRKAEPVRDGGPTPLECCGKISGECTCLEEQQQAVRTYTPRDPSTICYHDDCGTQFMGDDC